MKKILEIASPSIACDVDTADLMAILEVHHSTAAFKKWFVRNFIDLWCFHVNNEKVFGFSKPVDKRLHCFRQEGTKHDYFDAPFPDSSLHDCALLERKEYDRDTLEKKYDSIVDMVKDYINQDYYMFFEIDSFYVPCALFHGKIHYNSQTLFYGYDDEKRTLNVADFYGPFDRNVAYKFRELSYEDLIKAYGSYECSKNLEYERLLTVKFQENGLAINKGEIKYSLKRYLHGQNDTYNNIYFGVKCYDGLLEELDKKYLELSAFNYFYHHAKAMSMRAKYLKESLVLPSDFDSARFEKLESFAAACRNSLFKFVVSQERGVKEKTIEAYKRLREMDIACCQYFIDNITGEENVYRWGAGLK